MDSKNLRPLTHKEKAVLDFIELFFTENTISPSFIEIKNHFGFASNNSVQRYLKQLQTKGYIFVPKGNQKRAITILHSANTLHQNFVSTTPKPKSFASTGSVHPPKVTEPCSLPLLGKIAAGQPIESLEHNESVDVPFNFVMEPEKSYALKVEGDSMINEGIHSGDVIIVQDTHYAQNGDIVVAVIESEATLKKYYFHNDKNLIELRPSHPTMEPMWHHPSKVNIRGVLKNLIRKY